MTYDAIHFRQIARLGEYDLSTDKDGASPIDYAIAKTIVHEQYVPDIILNDIAIVKLKRQVSVNGTFYSRDTFYSQIN